MYQKSVMGKRIQELRKAEGITQEQLAYKIGVSMAAIRNYENGLREPNSKAMAALERYFKVSGEYLRGEVDHDPLLKHNMEIQSHLDDLGFLFQAFKRDFDNSSQENQKLALALLSGIMRTITDKILRYDSLVDLNDEQVIQVIQDAFDLNRQGRAELVKRSKELTQLTQYRD